MVAARRERTFEQKLPHSPSGDARSYLGISGDGSLSSLIAPKNLNGGVGIMLVRHKALTPI